MTWTLGGGLVNGRRGAFGGSGGRIPSGASSGARWGRFSGVGRRRRRGQNRGRCRQGRGRSRGHLRRGRGRKREHLRLFRWHRGGRRWPDEGGSVLAERQRRRRGERRGRQLAGLGEPRCPRRLARDIARARLPDIALARLPDVARARLLDVARARLPDVARCLCRDVARARLPDVALHHRPGRHALPRLRPGARLSVHPQARRHAEPRERRLVGQLDARPVRQGEDPHLGLDMHRIKSKVEGRRAVRERRREAVHGACGQRPGQTDLHPGSLPVEPFEHERGSGAQLGDLLIGRRRLEIRHIEVGREHEERRLQVARPERAQLAEAQRPVRGEGAERRRAPGVARVDDVWHGSARGVADPDRVRGRGGAAVGALVHHGHGGEGLRRAVLRRALAEGHSSPLEEDPAPFSPGERQADLG